MMSFIDDPMSKYLSLDSETSLKRLMSGFQYLSGSNCDMYFVRKTGGNPDDDLILL